MGEFFMTSLTNKYIFCYLILFFTTSLIAMEQPNSQLQNPREKDGVVYFDCSVMIAYTPDNPIVYAIPKYHNIHLYNKPSTPRDPLVVCNIVEPKINSILFLFLPVKQVINNANGNPIQFYVKPGTINLGNKHFRNKPSIFTIQFTNNPNLYGKSFSKQLKKNLHDFFINPSVIDPDDKQKLEKDGIVTSQTIIVPNFNSFEDGICHKNKEKKIFSHGPNNDGSSIEKIIASAEIPANQNRFLSLQYRETNGTFKK
jgi:hypothetical protein